MNMTMRNGAPLPSLGLGTWRLGESANRQALEIDSVARALQLGFRVFDTAEMYGEGGAERVVGSALQRLPMLGIHRGDVFLVSKVYPHHASRQGVAAACEASLERLGLEQLDLYLLHWRGAVPLAETVAGMHDLMARGRVRYWGVSNFAVDDMTELLALPGGTSCTCNQIYYSIGQRGIEHDLLPLMRDRGILAMAYSPLGQAQLLQHRGLQQLSSQLQLSAAQLALAWLVSQPGVMAIPKAVANHHLRENRAVANALLDEATRRELDALFPPPNGPTPLAML